jgi:hypothetical protein
LSDSALVEHCRLDPSATTQPIALAVSTIANYFESVSFRNYLIPCARDIPANTVADILDVGLAIAQLGTSSVTYRVGIFVHEDGHSQGHHPRACVVVDFTHVYVDPDTRKSVPIPDYARGPLSRILLPQDKKPRL